MSATKAALSPGISLQNKKGDLHISIMCEQQN
jgi:hypothetical protein